MRNEQARAWVEKHENAMRETLDFLWTHPETGYREWESSKFLQSVFESAGYSVVAPDDIPGFYADIDTGIPGPKVLILCELDALVAPNHFAAVNRRAHACGHNAQCAAMTGIALALKEPGALDGLSGSVRLMAVPAEEGVEIGFRESLRRQGTIEYYCGKDEFMRRGYMDGVDIAFMFHTGNREDIAFDCHKGGNGILIQSIDFIGKPAHAGGSPHLGVNALYAATLGIQAINALRETFPESDHIRVHPIMTSGGESVNIIPDRAHLDSYVRGATIEAMADANRKINRALAGCAIAMGAGVHVKNDLSYAPLLNDPNLAELAVQIMGEISAPEKSILTDHWGGGSTDMGNLSCIFPCIHPHVHGAGGSSHGDDYYLRDFETACILSAQGQLLLLNALLKNQAEKAKQIIHAFKPRYESIPAYFAAMNAHKKDEDLVVYPNKTQAEAKY